MYLKISQYLATNFEVTIIADTRNFVLRNEDGNEHGVFTKNSLVRLH